MSSLMLMLLVVFLLEQLILVVVSVYNAMTVRTAQDDLSKICRSFEMMLAEQEVNRKVIVMLNKRLGRQKSLVITLYQAIEAAAKGATQEEVLEKLRKFEPLVSQTKESRSDTVSE